MAFGALRAPGPTSSAFGGFGSSPAPSFQQQQPTVQSQQHIHFFTNEKTPVTYQTKWADIHPDSQKLLLQIEERILEYRHESQMLDQCGRLFEVSALNEDFEHDAARILQELRGNSTVVEREKVLLQELMNVVNGMLRNAEVAVRSFMIIQPRFIRPEASPSTQPATTAALSTNFPNSTASHMSTTTTMMDFYSGLPKKPSPFLQQTVARFERQLAECKQWIEELEHLLLPTNDETGSSSSDLTLLQSLPSVISSIHDFFIYVAAEVETIHQQIESMRAAYLADQRRRGDVSDPFLEADRRELAMREAAAKRVHPALHVSSFSQPSSQVTGLFTSSVAPATAFSGPSPSTQSSQGAFSSSGGGFSMFNTPASSSASSSFLLSAPTASSTGAFGSSTSQTQTMFGSSQTSSLFGANTSSSFPSATATANTSSVFSTPAFGTGAGNASSSSFGTNTVSYFSFEALLSTSCIVKFQLEFFLIVGCKHPIARKNRKRTRPEVHRSRSHLLSPAS